MAKIKGWLNPQHQLTEFVVCGRLYVLTQHYVPNWRSSAACLSPSSCQLCDADQPVQQIGALPLRQMDSEDIYLLRLLPSQRSLTDVLLNKGPSLIGSLISVDFYKENSVLRARIAFTGRVPTHEAPVGNYIAAIGKATYAAIVQRMTAQPELPDG